MATLVEVLVCELDCVNPGDTLAIIWNANRTRATLMNTAIQGIVLIDADTRLPSVRRARIEGNAISLLNA